MKRTNLKDKTTGRVVYKDKNGDLWYRFKNVIYKTYVKDCYIVYGK